MIGPGHVGDLLRVTPALEVLRRSRPGAFVCVLTRSRSAGLLQGNATVDRVITYDRRSPRWYMPDHLLLGRRLRALRFSTAIIFTGNRLLRRIARKSAIPSVFTAGLSFHKNRVLHNLDSVNEFGFPGRADHLSLFVSTRAREGVRQLLSDAGHREGSRLIGIQVGTRALSRGSTRAPSKAWAPEKIARLVDGLVGNMAATVVLTGKGHERAISAEVCSRASNPPLDFIDRTDLQGLAALAGFCDAFVSPDTGTMHVAASQQTRLVALFGPTSPVVDAPFMPRGRFTVIKRDTMEAIEVDDVLAALAMLLDD